MIIIAIVSVILTAFFVTYGTLPWVIKFLSKKNLLVLDYHKVGNVMIPRPGGISIIGGILSSEIVLFIFFPNYSILAIMIATFIAFVVGFIDDRKIMTGWFKPLALIVPAIPLLILGEYNTFLEFPLFGEVRIPILYIAVVVLMITLIGNTFNSIDVLNGVVSGFTIIASASLSIALLVTQSFEGTYNYGIIIASLSLVSISVAFYKFHKFPSKIFPGDSGAIVFGVMYASLAILGDIEIIAIIIILPAIINSFLFLSSVKRIVEHRNIKNRPVHFKDMKLYASDEKNAPITLVRLILVGRGPLGEKQICHEIFKLAIFSGSIGILTAFFTGIMSWI